MLCQLKRLVFRGEFLMTTAKNRFRMALYFSYKEILSH